MAKMGWKARNTLPEGVVRHSDLIPRSMLIQEFDLNPGIVSLSRRRSSYGEPAI